MREDDEEPPACVPFLAFRCPSCGATKPRTYSQSGRTRWHQCRECSCKYKSLEIDVATMWDPDRLRRIFPAPK